MKYSKFNPLSVTYPAFKNTLLLVAVLSISCGNLAPPKDANSQTPRNTASAPQLKTGAENTAAYMNLIAGRNVGIVTNQTGIVGYDSIYNPADNANAQHMQAYKRRMAHLVDFLLANKVNVKAIYAPEHGFRGTADAGELIKDGKDTKTGLPIISLYGNNKKPKKEQLAGIDVMLFDLQDVGARFYTYISTLHYVMEACAENNIELIVLDRPNPNGSIVDGPVLEKEHVSFVGMHTIPVLHGMTIGEYARMINGERWLKNGVQAELTVIPCLDYDRKMAYSLPVKPSPNLPNDRAINLYSSLCFFEGTNVSVGRGTNKQFQIYGSPDLPFKNFSFIPTPNEGSKEPPHKGTLCFGEDLSAGTPVNRLELKWLLKAYAATPEAKRATFFNPFFTKLAGTKTLQEQIVAGLSEDVIRKSWENGLASFRKVREKYLIYR